VQSFSKYRIVVMALLGVLYLTLTQRYRAYDLDSPWFLSFSYNYCHGDIESDTFIERRYPLGMDGVHLFGKVPATAQCLVMDRTGWSPTSIVWLNLVLALASLWLLSEFLRRLGYGDRWTAAFLLLLGVSESFVSMVEKGRYEILAFLLLSLALWLGVRGWELAAALIAMLAVEVEPAAIIVPVLVILVLAFQTQDRGRLGLRLLVCAAVALPFYLLLHPGAIQEMARAHYPPGKSIFDRTVFAYFLERRRHLPELAMLVLGVGLYWRHRKEIGAAVWMGLSLPMWLAASSLVLLALLQHPNPAYEVFAAPFLLWPALEGYGRAPRWRCVPALVCAGILLQYGYLFHLNRHEGFDRQEIAVVQQQIASAETQLAVGDSQLRICGDYSLWFAHPEHYSACDPERPAAIRSADLFLCFDGHLMPDNLSGTAPSCAEVGTVRRLREISSVVLRGHRLHVEVPQ
jgi:hypothetical protein